MSRKKGAKSIISKVMALMLVFCMMLGVMPSGVVLAEENSGFTEIDDAVVTTTGELFKIQYESLSRWHAESGYPDLFFDGTDHYSDTGSNEDYYEMKFIGTGIEIYGSKNRAHANCDVYIDGEKVGEVLSETTGTTIHKQKLFEKQGLANEAHVLKVVRKSGATKALQVDKIRVYHGTLSAAKITLNAESIKLGIGGAKQLEVVAAEPWVVENPEIVWSSADESVATVDANGLVRAVYAGDESKETVVTATVKGTSVSASVKVIVDSSAGSMMVSIGDEKILDTQSDYEKLSNAEFVGSWEGTAWKGDTLNSKIIVLTKEADIHNLTITASNFENEDGEILAAENISVKWLKEVLAREGRNMAGDLKVYPDIIHKGGPTDVAAESLKFAWVSMNVPENTKAGVYTGTLTVNANELKKPVELIYTIKVLDLVQPAVEATDIQIWQHPFSVANYYLGLGSAQPGGICNELAEEFYFTEEHFNLMRESTIEYASMGGHDWVANIVEEAWNHQSYYNDPSMVKWTKKTNGTWEYDYTWYDAWVEFGIECGVIDPETGLGQIKCYSIVPWNNQVTYYDEASGRTVKESHTPGAAAWTAIWTPFLEDFMEHSKEMGWFDITYISMDERTMDQLQPTVDLIESVTDENGKSFKISSALNYAAPSYYDFTDRIHDISINLGNCSDREQMNQLAEHRRSLGLKTTMYTCTGNYPSNFVLSDPGDNYWQIWYTMTLGVDGFLRWAWDNYVYDMHGNITYRYWEPGDGWFIYPIERDEVGADYEAGFYSTPKYEMFKQGIRDVAKAKYLMKQSSELKREIERLVDSIVCPQVGFVNGSATYANEVQRMLTHSETDRVFEAVMELAEGHLSGTIGKIQVACVGDSLTDGFKSTNGNKSNTAYPAYLQQLLGDKYEVGNFGKTGAALMKNHAQSYWDTAEFEESLAFEPDVVIIMLGSNDTKSWNEEAYRADAVALVNEYKALATNPRIIFAISPQCYVKSGTGITAAGVDVVAEVQRSLAAENSWDTVDMHEKTEGKEALYHSDLLHFTDGGYYYVAQCMYTALTGEELLMPDDASRDLPIDVLRVTAGDSYTGEGPSRVLDGNAATLWHTDWYGTSNENHWIQFEITEDYVVDGLRYQPRQSGDNGKITSYEILVSEDGTEWKTIAAGTWSTDPLWKNVGFEGERVKYVRLVSKASYSGNVGYVFTSAAEIRLTGELFETEIPTPEVCEVFGDVSHGEWYEGAVQYVYDNGIMSGNEGLFKPTGNITRAQVVMTLYNLEGKPAVTDYSAVTKLADVEGGQWYTDAVCWAYNTGVTTGNDVTKMFEMNKNVTRQQLATFFYRYAELKGFDVSASADISGMAGAGDVADYAAKQVKWAVGAGLIKGSESVGANGTIVYDLKPTGTATRAQVATILQRFCEANNF